MKHSLLADIKIFKDAVESASNHIVITDLDGTILYANKAAEAITGYSIKEMLGKTPRIWGTQMPSEFYTNMWETIKVQKTAFRGEVRNRRKSAELYDALIVISPIIESNGELIGFIGTEEDISQIKKVEKELLQQNDELKRLTKMMVDRELRMIELKKMLNDTKKTLNPGYN
jgi:PAS domain S-box-containing protein